MKERPDRNLVAHEDRVDDDRPAVGGSQQWFLSERLIVVNGDFSCNDVRRRVLPPESLPKIGRRLELQSHEPLKQRRIGCVGADGVRVEDGRFRSRLHEVGYQCTIARVILLQTHSDSQLKSLAKILLDRRQQLAEDLPAAPQAMCEWRGGHPALDSLSEAPDGSLSGRIGAVVEVQRVSVNPASPDVARDERDLCECAPNFGILECGSVRRMVFADQNRPSDRKSTRLNSSHDHGRTTFLYKAVDEPNLDRRQELVKAKLLPLHGGQLGFIGQDMIDSGAPE